jgi:hypothetical protein
MADKLMATLLHSQLSWLRRPELDESFEGYYVYEEPDGDLVLSKDPRHKYRALLNVWQDAKTKELYTTFSSTPYFTGRHQVKSYPPPKQKSQP